MEAVVGKPQTQLLDTHPLVLSSSADSIYHFGSRTVRISYFEGEALAMQRVLEESGNFTLCNNTINTGDQLEASATQHALLWTTPSQQDAVMLAGRNLAKLRLLTVNNIGWSLNSDRVPFDIIFHPDKYPIFYIGNLDPEAAVRLIPSGMDKGNFNCISPNSLISLDLSGNFRLFYKGDKSSITILPITGERYTTVTFTDVLNSRPSFKKRYMDYVNLGGVISPVLMRAVTRLNEQQVAERFGEETQIGVRRDWVEKLARRVGVPIQEIEIGLYLNLRKIADSADQNIYGSGWKPSPLPDGRVEKVALKYVHPNKLGELALLWNIKMWIGDTESLKRLENYARDNSLYW